MGCLHRGFYSDLGLLSCLKVTLSCSREGDFLVDDSKALTDCRNFIPLAAAATAVSPLHSQAFFYLKLDSFTLPLLAPSPPHLNSNRNTGPRLPNLLTTSPCEHLSALSGFLLRAVSCACLDGSLEGDKQGGHRLGLTADRLEELPLNRKEVPSHCVMMLDC